jgi:hypothetical protein
VVGTVQAVELAQHRRGGGLRLRFFQAGNEDFDASSENKRFLIVQGRLAARGEQNSQQERQDCRETGFELKRFWIGFTVRQGCRR